MCEEEGFIEITQEAHDAGLVWMEAQASAWAERLAPVYMALWWTWRKHHTPPNTEEIERCVRDLIAHVRAQDVLGGSCRAGGLAVGFVWEGEGQHRPYIRFTLEETDWDALDRPAQTSA